VAGNVQNSMFQPDYVHIGDESRFTDGERGRICFPSAYEGAYFSHPRSKHHKASDEAGRSSEVKLG